MTTTYSIVLLLQALSMAAVAFMFYRLVIKPALRFLAFVVVSLRNKK